MTSPNAMELTAFVVSAITEPELWVQISISLSPCNAFLIYFCASNIFFALALSPPLPNLRRLAQVPAITAPGRLPAMHVVA